MRDHVTATCRSYFSIWGSCGPSEDHWRLMQLWHWHRRSCMGGHLDSCNSLLWCQRESSATFAKFPECGGKIHHCCEKIRSCVAWSLLVTYATKDNYQECHFDVQVLELFGTSLPDCIEISSMPGRWQLRSAASGQLYIPRTKTMTFGPRSFKVSSPTIRKLLNTLIFNRWRLHLRFFINLRGEMYVINE